jgi:hypothetical protein
MRTYLIRYLTENRQPRLIGIQAANQCVAIRTCKQLPDFSQIISVMLKTKTRYAIKCGAHLLSRPGHGQHPILLTDSESLALKFVTYEKAQQIALLIRDHVQSELQIVSLEMDL